MDKISEEKVSAGNEITETSVEEQELWMLTWNASLGEDQMEWTSPQFEEIALHCEINSYACAEL